ncbi:Carbon monoxide dehydrogenase subunit G [Polaromonas sp. OV174]|uniref:SRPBCC family protein n=1 Tax=Polaromonas sp. OV174 TaxID=1855300 RepID=UPI0008F05F52|nr:SRPBCC family protein [Polaromonas sp. OV174]SFB68403.1 Carbon monoxide dehydrogenase subunit G [Polaromonas sp. OV174]
MEFSNHFFVPLPLEDAWKLMLDVPRIMPCLPGAKLTEILGPDKYRGSVSVKLGPIKLAFDGQAELVKKDDANHIAWLKGSGLDPKGRGAAQSEFSFALKPEGSGTAVTVTTQLQLSGAVAQYGRGSGMIAEVASHILKQFESNLADSLSQDDLPNPAATHAAVSNASVPPNPVGAAIAPPPANFAMPPLASGGQALDAQTLLYQAQAVLGQAQSVMASTQEMLLRFQAGNATTKAPKPKPQQELNMLSIGLKALWSQIKFSISGLFGRPR